MTALRPPLRPLPSTAEAEVTQWLNDYISMPHEDLGRDGPVCPFVPKALRRGLVVTVGRTWTPAETDERAAVTDLILDAVEAFRDRVWPAEHPELRAVVAVAMGMPQHKWPLLDEVQRVLKGRIVTAGLMLGPFHPDSGTPAAHNPAFHPNTSPMPLVVVRQMARHDLWFLHQRADWFREYQKRFPLRDQGSATALSKLYRAASKRHG